MDKKQFQIAQVNVARYIAPPGDPILDDFVAQIAGINALADTSPGFVWRLKSEYDNDALSLRPFEDERILVNLSVWEDVESLKHYVYKTAHAAVLRDRKRWFERMQEPSMAIWYIPKGSIPTMEEMKARLTHIQKYGASEFAFDFKNLF
ncbi:MAG: hypothetical protein RLZZ628_4506 [Bacteroidota bacterium]|jgi:hypothetical protein